MGEIGQLLVAGLVGSIGAVALAVGLWLCLASRGRARVAGNSRRSTAVARVAFVAPLSLIVVLLEPQVAGGITSPGIDRVSDASGVLNGDPDGESSRALISGDGRYSIFHSEADNLVLG